uniref:ATP synthase complex subunit 8 n=1 Tax=Aphyosemion gabunense TaxID=60284 RepID=A0A518LR60_9TELE|nr:ATP synthase F0 subunit 8 [Aphyosemion gabunense]QDV92587.1 ATP synthase F0 subunit 8 [Aphyosemion gabunense]
MPQLNPAPWFIILIFAWVVFLVMMPPKVLAHKSSNNPELPITSSSKTEFWAWPWQ